MPPPHRLVVFPTGGEENAKLEVENVAGGRQRGKAVDGVLTQRQRRLIMLLVQAGDWRTSAELAELLQVSSKLVKQEVRAIRCGSAAGLVDIRSSNRRGYRLAGIADGLRDELLHEFDVHDGHHSITRRYTRLYLYLLIEGGPVSTAALAARFFCSKAAIADEVDVLRYRLGRMAHVGLEVNARRGLSVAGAVDERWYEASKWPLEELLDEIPFDGARAHRIRAALDAAVPVVRALLAPLAGACRVSGGDVRRITRYVALEVACGGEGEPGEAVDAMVERVVRGLGALENAGARREPRDMLERLLADCVVPLVPSDIARTAADRLVRDVAAYLGETAAEPVAARAGKIACDLTCAIGRLEAGHGALNYHASLTVARHPLESWLATRAIARVGAFGTAKAEASLLALGLADILEPACGGVRVRLATSEHLAVARHTAELIRRELGDMVDRVDLDLLGAGETPQDAFTFSTDPQRPPAPGAGAMLSSLPSASEVHAAREALIAWRDARLAELAARVWSRRPSAAGETDGLQAFLSAREQACLAIGSWDARPGCEVCVLSAYRTLVLVEEGDRGAVERGPAAGRPSGIEEWEPDHPLRYRGKVYRRVIELGVCRGADIAARFELVGRELVRTARD